MQQATSSVFMVRPDYFLYNEETALSNAFQQQSDLHTREELQEKALAEFDLLVKKLRSHNIEVFEVKDTPHPPTPDAVFPNNWVMLHHSGEVSLFPMAAESRRKERRLDIIDQLKETFEIRHVTDLSPYEKEQQYLEGTGSIVFDHANRIAYACISPRTDPELFREFCRNHQYRPESFHAFDTGGRAIYHTNVMMCVGREIAVICLESITHPEEKARIKNSLEVSGHEIIAISPEQMHRFAGNMLQLTNPQGEELLVMSEQAYKALTPAQVNRLEARVNLLHSPLYTIEQAGGGSARCMIAEIFLPRLP